MRAAGCVRRSNRSAKTPLRNGPRQHPVRRVIARPASPGIRPVRRPPPTPDIRHLAPGNRQSAASERELATGNRPPTSNVRRQGTTIPKRPSPVRSQPVRNIPSHLRPPAAPFRSHPGHRSRTPSFSSHPAGRRRPGMSEVRTAAIRNDASARPARTSALRHEKSLRRRRLCPVETESIETIYFCSLKMRMATSRICVSSSVTTPPSGPGSK